MAILHARKEEIRIAILVSGILITPPTLPCFPLPSFRIFELQLESVSNISKLRGHVMLKQKLYMSIALLICCQLCVLQAQEQHKISLKKMAPSFNSPFRNIVFHAPGEAQIPQPKIVVKWKSIDFLAENGTIKKQFTSNSDIFVKLSSNGEFIGVQHGQLQMYERGRVGDAEFALLNGDGELLWKETYKTYWDEPSDVYDVSSLGTVSKITWYEGTVTFYDKSGIKLANHLILAGANKGISAKWSPDGRFFAITSKDAEVNDPYQQQLLVYDNLGNRLWKQIFPDKSNFGILRFSTAQTWVLVAHANKGEGLKASLVNTAQGNIGVTYEDQWVTDGKFSPDERLLLGHLVINNVSYLALYETAPGRKWFRFNTEGRLLDYGFIPGRDLICFLVNKKIPSFSRPPDSSSPEAVREALLMKDVNIGFVDFKGNLVSLTYLPTLQVLPGEVSMRLDSNPGALSIFTGNEILNYMIEN